jgi:hypothetical protein
MRCSSLGIFIGRVPLLSLALCLINIGCKPAADQSASNNAAENFAFHWNSPQVFQVEETAQRQGNTVKARYTLSLTNSNDELVLRWVDAEFLSLNGTALTVADRKALAPQRAMVLANPPMRIGRDGSFLGALHTKESVEEVSRLLDKAFPDRPAEVREFYSKMAASPEGQALAESALSQRYWNTWVGTWADFDLKPGETKTNRAVSSPGGVELNCQVLLKHKGYEKNGYAHLQYEETARGPEVGQAILKLIGDIAHAASTNVDSGFPEITNASYRVNLEVVTDSSTLKPSWASRSVEMVLNSPGVKPVEVRESYEFNFLWEKARPDFPR